MVLKMESECLGSRLVRARKIRDISQGDLAEVMGLSRQQISNYENGRIIPRGNVLMRLAQALNVTQGWLLLGEGSEPEGQIAPKVNDNTSELTELQRNLLADLKELTAEQQKYVASVVQEIKEKNQQIMNELLARNERPKD